MDNLKSNMRQFNINSLIIIAIIILLIGFVMFSVSMPTRSMEDKITIAKDIIKRYPWLENMTLRQILSFAEDDPISANGILELVCR